MRLLRLSSKLVDEREYVTMIASEQFAQVDGAFRVTLVALRFAHRTACLESPGDLVVQFGPIGDDDSGPIPREFPENLLREEHHRKALPRTLCLPKYTSSPVT
jgi:hypothetical protein